MDTVVIDNICETARMELWEIIETLEITVRYAESFAFTMGYVIFPVERAKVLLQAFKQIAEAKDEMR